MKSLLVMFGLLTVMFLGACTTAQTNSFASNDFFVKLHGDLNTAAAYASANNQQARADVIIAFDKQVTACQNAIMNSTPVMPASGVVGVVTLAEIADEAAATGVPANVKLACSVLQLPSLPLIIK